MAGLLGNGWDDPQSSAMLALSGGLLRGDFGGGLLGANSAYQGAQEGALKRQYMGAQMQNMQSEIEARKAALEKQRQLQDMVSRLFGGGAPAGSTPQGVLGSGSFGIVPPAGGQPDIPPPRPAGLGNASIDQIAGLHAAGGPDLLNAYKFATEGVERKPGSFYDIPGKPREFIPDVKSGMNYSNGAISAIPGYNNFLTQQTLATEGPKAILGSAGRVNLRPNADGTQSPIPELAENPLLQRLLGGGMGAMSPAAPSAPAGVPPVGSPGRPMTSPVEQKARDAEALGIMQAELNKPGLAPDVRAGIEREIARMQGSQTQQGYPTPSLARNPGGAPAYGMNTQQSAAAKSAVSFSESMARQQAESLDKSFTTAKTASDDLMGISEARKALQSGAFAGSGAEFKLSVAKFVNANVPGLTIEADKVANTDYLKSTLGRGLLEQAKTLGSNPSNADANRINDIVGSIGKDPAAMQKILDWREQMARRSIDMHNGKVDDAEKRGYQAPYDMRVQAQAPQRAQDPGGKPPVPMKGMVRGGYKFKGGDPASSSNWEKI